jgi:hypothetical protein
MAKEENIVNYPNSIDTRVALLESSIATINQTMFRLENKMDKGFDDMKKDAKADFRWLLTIIGGLGFIMAHGFHWF